MIDVDALAQEIRRVDGKHSLGAGQLAEALMPFLTALTAKTVVEGLTVCDAFDVLSLSEAYGGSGATSVSSKDLAALDRAVKALRAALSAGTATPGDAPKYCQCENSVTATPCIVCGKPKLVSREWFERMADKEGDLEIGAGTATPKPEGEALVSAINGSPIASFVQSYQFEASDEGIVHTPTHAEQCMIEDAICSFISEPGLLEAALWQPIKTAPKDGTFIITRAGRWTRPAVVHWASYGDVTKWGGDPECFMEEDHFMQYWTEVSYDPTEWVPLEALDRLSASTAGGGK